MRKHFYGKNLHNTHMCDKEAEKKEKEWEFVIAKKGFITETSQKYHDNSSSRDFHEKF